MGGDEGGGGGDVAGKRPTVVVVFNQKGGIGKTTTSVNLAVCLAAYGRSVILIDLDSQGNATTSVGQASPVATGAYQLLRGEATFEQAVRKTPYPHLRLVAGSDDLSWVDVELAVAAEPQGILRRAVAGVPAGTEVVVVDCPPAFGILSVNAVVAADAVVLPVVPSPLALDGLHKAWWNIQRVRTHFNRDLDAMHIVLTMTEPDETASRLAEAIIAAFGGRVLPVLVPRDGRVAEAAGRDLPVVVLDPDADVSQAYLRLAELIQARLFGTAIPRDREAAVAELRAWRQPHDVDEAHPPVLPPLRESPPVEAGPPPAADWASELDLAELAAALPPGWVWKVGAALLLVVTGFVVGFVGGLSWTAG